MIVHLTSRLLDIEYDSYWFLADVSDRLGGVESSNKDLVRDCRREAFSELEVAEGVLIGIGSHLILNSRRDQRLHVRQL